MKATLILAAAALAIATPVFAAERTFEVDAFTKARIDTTIHAKITVGKAQSITAESIDPATLDNLRIEVIGGRLHMWLDTDFWDFAMFRDNSVNVTITVPSLVGIEANATANVTVAGMRGDEIEVGVGSASQVALTGVNAGSAHIEASSAALLMIDGYCTTAVVNISSSSSIFADKFECVNVDVEASSASGARLFASGNVTADVSSAANVVFYGSPDHVDDEVSSAGDVHVM